MTHVQHSYVRLPMKTKHLQYTKIRHHRVTGNDMKWLSHIGVKDQHILFSIDSVSIKSYVEKKIQIYPMNPMTDPCMYVCYIYISGNILTHHQHKNTPVIFFSIYIHIYIYIPYIHTYGSVMGYIIKIDRSVGHWDPSWVSNGSSAMFHWDHQHRLDHRSNWSWNWPLGGKFPWRHSNDWLDALCGKQNNSSELQWNH